MVEEVGSRKIESNLYRSKSELQWDFVVIYLFIYNNMDVEDLILDWLFWSLRAN